MKNTSNCKIREICNAVLLSGLIVLAIGAYYVMVKAGIPYQDPTVELQIRYAVNYGIGNALLKLGLILLLCGGIARLIILWMSRNDPKTDK